MQQRKPVPVIMDCDPGVDDAIGLALALASPEIELCALTTVAGNDSIEQVTHNAYSLLRLLGRTDIPVGVGAGRQFVHAYAHGLPSPHGANGLGDVQLAAVVASGTKGAVELIRDVLAARYEAAGPDGATGRESDKVTILATGPLTNIAVLAATYPHLLGCVERVIVMGGSSGRGNVTPVAEFNTWFDPEAAQRVFTEPGLDVLLVGLDVTRDARLSTDDVALIAAGGAPQPSSETSGSALAQMLEGYDDQDARGWAVHDALVIAALLAPELLTTRPALVEVDTGTGPTRGQTRIAFDEEHPARHNRYASTGSITMATGLDAAGFRSLVVDRLGPSPRGQGGETSHSHVLEGVEHP